MSGRRSRLCSQCFLDHVHSEVVTSIETGGPCPTIDSDPDGVTLAIEDCRIVTRGCGPESLTAHLCLHWCEIPEPPDLPVMDCFLIFVDRPLQVSEGDLRLAKVCGS